MEIKKIDVGFGVEIETRENENARIHNLISNKKGVRNLGVKFKEAYYADI